MSITIYSCNKMYASLLNAQHRCPALLGSQPTGFCCFCIIYFSETWQQSANSWEGWPEHQTNTNYVILLWNFSPRKLQQLAWQTRRSIIGSSSAPLFCRSILCCSSQKDITYVTERQTEFAGEFHVPQANIIILWRGLQRRLSECYRQTSEVGTSMEFLILSFLHLRLVLCTEEQRINFFWIKSVD